MRRSPIALAATAIVAACAPAAHAGDRCATPDRPAWRSCLTAAHTSIEGSDDVQLTRATATLVIRSEACPRRLVRRRVTIRDHAGARLAAKRVDGRCRRGVARWRAILRPDGVVLPAGAVVRSYWSRLRDERGAPRVRLGPD